MLIALLDNRYINDRNSSVTVDKAGLYKAIARGLKWVRVGYHLRIDSEL